MNTFYAKKRGETLLYSIQIDYLQYLLYSYFN
jgi:hypothetical protein